ncbi:MAG: protein translocase subunit SecD [Pirellulales bacterium]
MKTTSRLHRFLFSLPLLVGIALVWPGQAAWGQPSDADRPSTDTAAESTPSETSPAPPAATAAGASEAKSDAGAEGTESQAVPAESAESAADAASSASPPSEAADKDQAPSGGSAPADQPVAAGDQGAGGKKAGETIGAKEKEEAGAVPAKGDRGRNIPVPLLLLIVVAVIALPFLAGNWFANSVRMPDQAWRISLALFAITSATVITIGGWPPHLGTDLSGGVNLIYELDQETKQADTQVDMNRLIAAIAQRVNPGGVKEVTIRQYGADQVEIIIPRADETEIDLIKRKISTAGSLEFRITADEKKDEEIIILAKAQRAKGIKRIKRDTRVVARWVRLNRKEFDPARDKYLVTHQNERGEWEVLVLVDPQNVTGEYLVTATKGIDDRGRPAVNFTFNARGASRFLKLTKANLPNRTTNFYRHLGIVLDDELRTAPQLNDVISDRGQISGSFTQEEVDFLISILNAGSLPAALNKQPIKDDIVSATLGADTVEKGRRAIGISMIAVLIFMAVYYRFSGLVACTALIGNLVLVLAVMILIKAAFTLPGLAGLVLTVGMAVDANVLIYERMREELNRGAALRMAIRNGFGKATRTIVDANITTLITAVVLYWIGTDQIRGFAVTLILGIVMSMFTAIFCSRIVFDIAEKKRWITELKMRQLFGSTSFDFVGKRYVAFACSFVIIIIGMIAVVGRGRDLLDIDFTGGTSVTLLLNRDQAMDIAEVRQVVTSTEGLEDAAVVGVGEENLMFKINNRNRDIEAVQDQLREAFEGRLRMNSLDFDQLEPITGKSAAEKATGDAATDPHDSKDPSATPADDPYLGGTTAQLSTAEPIGHDAMHQLIQDALTAAGRPGIVFEIGNPEYQAGSNARYTHWNLKIALDPAETKTIVSSVHDQLAAVPVFPSSSNIGGKVAGDTQAQAGYAFFASLLFIVGYIWLRFQRIMFGLAAVAALVHDVLITLGMLALSGYLVQFANPVASLLLVDPFKISLPIVAAFLTIIGYSLNDTIVVFDRIREGRGKSSDLTAKMLNTSINSTLGRTVLTSLTTLLVVAILYAMGGSGIHGFAFALVVGVVAGTYSSIFVASPVLLWMSNSGQPAKK